MERSKLAQVEYVTAPLATGLYAIGSMALCSTDCHDCPAIKESGKSKVSLQLKGIYPYLQPVQSN